MTTEHRHGEAFCLMTYLAKQTGEREVLWNSRDGVTPFIIPSRSGVLMQHINFRDDRYAPLHVPKVGDRVFADLTELRARQLAAEFVDNAPPELRATLGHEYGSRSHAVESVAHRMLEHGGGGAPDILVVNAGWLEQLATSRAGVLQ